MPFDKIKNSLGICGKVVFTAFISSLILNIIFSVLVLVTIVKFYDELLNINVDLINIIGVLLGGFYLLILILFTLRSLTRLSWNPHGGLFLFSYVLFSIIFFSAEYFIFGDPEGVIYGLFGIFVLGPVVLVATFIIGQLVSWITRRFMKVTWIRNIRGIEVSFSSRAFWFWEICQNRGRKSRYC